MTTAPTGQEGPPTNAVAAAWGASPSSVRDYVLNTAAEGVRPRQTAPRVGDATLAEWLLQAAGIVRARTVRASSLPAAQDPPPAPQRPLTLAEVDPVRKHLVELYAAALLADVTHPERAQADRSPGAPLMARFREGLDALGSAVEAALVLPDLDPVTPGVQAGGGAAWSFPPPRITYAQGW